MLELGESIEDGLRREVCEETGLIVEPIALTGVYKNIRLGIIALVFRCRRVAGDLTPNAEVTQFHWATRDEVPVMAREAFGVRVLDALDHLSYPAVCLHDGVGLLLDAPSTRRLVRE